MTRPSYQLFNTILPNQANFLGLTSSKQRNVIWIPLSCLCFPHWSAKKSKFCDIFSNFMGLSQELLHQYWACLYSSECTFMLNSDMAVKIWFFNFHFFFFFKVEKFWYAVCTLPQRVKLSCILVIIPSSSPAFVIPVNHNGYSPQSVSESFRLNYKMSVLRFQH